MPTAPNIYPARVRGISLVQETIAFQKDSADIKANIEKHIETIREYSAGRENQREAIYRSKAVSDLCAYVKQRMGLNLRIPDNPKNQGPAMLSPNIFGDHVFFSDDDLAMANAGYLDLDYYSKYIFKVLEQPFYEAGVDLKNCKFSGAFGALRADMLVPLEEFTNRSILSASQLADVLLHEIGHLANTYIMIISFVRANQVINLIAKAGKHPGKLEIVVARSAADIGVSEREKQIIIESKGEKTLVAKIILDRIRARCKNEIGGDVYSSVSCEQMADQFAVRCGAGIGLVTALELYRKHYESEQSIVEKAAQLLILLILIMYTFGLFILLMIIGPERKDLIYDSDHFRYKRVRAQLIEKLKTIKMPSADKAELIEEIDGIEKIMHGADKDNGLFEKLRTFLRSGYRSEKELEELQKTLEVLASNDLYVESTRLQILAERSKGHGKN